MVRTGSSGSSGYAHVVVVFVRVRLVCRCVLLHSSGSFRCPMGVARISLVRQDVPWGSLISLAFVWFVRVGRRVRSGSSRSWEGVVSVAVFV